MKENNLIEGKDIQEGENTHIIIPIKDLDRRFEDLKELRNKALPEFKSFYESAASEVILIKGMGKEISQTPNTEEAGEVMPKDFKEITGHDTPKEMKAYEQGRQDEATVIYDWIKKWDGSTNSEMGELLLQKAKEIFKEGEQQEGKDVKEIPEVMELDALINTLVVQYGEYYNANYCKIQRAFWKAIDAIRLASHPQPTEDKKD